MVTTRVDQDKLADVVSIDEHAAKLVGVKAASDRARFSEMVERPLSLVEVFTAAAGALLVLGSLVLVLLAL